MTTPERDENAWRRHEVPTFLDARDEFAFGLTFKQIFGIAVSAGIGYLSYQLAIPLPFWYRIALGIVAAVVCVAFVAIRPGGRSLASVVRDIVLYQFGPKHYSEPISTLLSPLPPSEDRSEEPRRKFSFPWSKRDSGGAAAALLVCGAAMAMSSISCQAESAHAQTSTHYVGKRLYLQSVVVNYEGVGSLGNETADIHLRAAAPLHLATPRVNETVRSASEAAAHTSGVQPARRVIAGQHMSSLGEVSPVRLVPTGSEFAFKDILLSDWRQLRPFCDVPLENGQWIGRADTEGYFFRHSSRDCRLLPPLELAFGRDAGVSDAADVAKPALSVHWEDVRQNVGDLVIASAMLPYPAPSLYRLDQELMDFGSELLNARDICDPREIEVVSMGIQSAVGTPAGYFEGGSGQRVAGEIRVCSLERGDRTATVGLGETIVFAQGEADFEISVRPIVTTLLPDNVVNRARLYVLDRNGRKIVPTDGFPVPLSIDPGYDPSRKNHVKFNIPASSLILEEKFHPQDLDTRVLQLQLEVDHVVTVKRPVYQPVDFFPQYLVEHISSCTCRCSGTDTCRKTSRENYQEYEYWPDHYRVDAAARQYLPDSPSSDVTLVYQQTFVFDPMTVTFDKPYREFVYVEPTPQPGVLQNPDYEDSGDVITYTDNGPIICDRSIGTNAAGEPSGWIWVEPGVNSQGDSYGGCRPDFFCRLDIPPQEEIFGTGGSPLEEDYECIRRK